MSEAFELKNVLNRKPSKLSGGQQQRVSLARALIRDPSVLLLDEPLSHMDQRLRAILRARIRRIHDELSTATIYVTHDQEEAVALADKIIVMNLGVIQQIGTVDELWNRPANQFVAGFLGEPAMNLMKGKVGEKNQLAIANGDSYVSWEISDPLPTNDGLSDIIAGIRPDKLKVSTEKNDVGLKAKVKVTEFQGDYLILTFDLADMEYKAIVQETFSLEPGTDVWIWADPKDIHVFEAKTEKALNKIS
jgi:multiple sugar transport system ATP-binding protein